MAAPVQSSDLANRIAARRKWLVGGAVAVASFLELRRRMIYSGAGADHLAAAATSAAVAATSGENGSPRPAGPSRPSQGGGASLTCRRVVLAEKQILPVILQRQICWALQNVFDGKQTHTHTHTESYLRSF